MDKIHFQMDKQTSKYNINGVFEVHITVQCDNDNELAVFLECCNKNNVKPIIIELSNGDYVRQVMTSSFIVGNYKDDIINKTKILVIVGLISTLLISACGNSSKDSASNLKQWTPEEAKKEFANMYPEVEITRCDEAE